MEIHKAAFSVSNLKSTWISCNTSMTQNWILEFLFSLFIAQGSSRLFFLSGELWMPHTCSFMFLGVSHVASQPETPFPYSFLLRKKTGKIKHSQKVIDYSSFLLIYHCIFHNIYQDIDYIFSSLFVYELQGERGCFLSISTSPGSSRVRALCVEWVKNQMKQGLKTKALS